MDLVAGLIEIAHKKEEHLQELLRLTTTQKLFIKAGDMEKLSEAIDQKQMVMEQIHELDVVFLERYGQLKREYQIESLEDMDGRVPQLKILKLSTHKIMKLLKQIEGIDGENKEALKADLEKVRNEMKKVKMKQQSSKLASTYQNKYVGGQGVFVDNKKNE